MTPPRHDGCETDRGLPIDPTDAVLAALVGWFRRVVVDSDGTELTEPAAA